MNEMDVDARYISREIMPYIHAGLSLRPVVAVEPMPAQSSHVGWWRSIPPVVIIFPILWHSERGPREHVNTTLDIINFFLWYVDNKRFGGFLMFVR